MCIVGVVTPVLTDKDVSDAGRCVQPLEQGLCLALIVEIGAVEIVIHIPVGENDGGKANPWNIEFLAEVIQPCVCCLGMAVANEQDAGSLGFRP